MRLDESITYNTYSHSFDLFDTSDTLVIGDTNTYKDKWDFDLFYCQVYKRIPESSTVYLVQLSTYLEILKTESYSIYVVDRLSFIFVEVHFSQISFQKRVLEKKRDFLVGLTHICHEV